MGNRHYHGDGGKGNRDEPSVEASGVRIVFAWIVALMFLATAQGGLRDPAGNYVEFSYGQPLGPGSEEMPIP